MAATVEVNDLVFCQNHLAEVCEDCDADFREQNDYFYGIECFVDRDALQVPAHEANGIYKCNDHGSATCTHCFGWKKAILRLRAAAQ